jgi:molybdenum cofactor synthesis domain-containing protein
VFRRLVSLEEAKRRIAEACSPRPLGSEQVALTAAVGRVLAETVVSPLDVPPFSRSTVDGYAVKANDTFGAEENTPARLRVSGSAAVGALPDLAVKKGEAVEIVTGAPLPAGADAVVMAEYTADEKGKLAVYKPAVTGENVMAKGSDIRAREVVLECGCVLGARELGVLAALGFTAAPVFSRPRVAILSTGTEIVAPGTPLPPGKIFDINTSTLTATTTENGGQPIPFDIVREDDAGSLKRALKRAVAAADVVVTSGGVSVGPKDVLPRVLNDLGDDGLVVHGLTVKPGKPVAFAVVKGVPVFSLPGHPTSSLLMFHLLVRPTLLTMAGRSPAPPLQLKAVLTQKLFPARGRRTFIMVTLTPGRPGGWRATQVSGGESGAITTLAKADGYVEIPETQQFVAAGSTVTVTLFRPLYEPRLL